MFMKKRADHLGIFQSLAVLGESGFNQEPKPCSLPLVACWEITSGKKKMSVTSNIKVIQTKNSLIKALGKDMLLAV